jgi:hypothetical protein
MLKKLFGKKKDKSYFLEIENQQEEKKVETASAEPEKVETTTKVESQKEAVAQNKTTTKLPEKTTKVPTYEPPAWVKAIKNYSNNNQSGESQESLTFAPNYLMPNSPTPRRRPGGSLKLFKEMASNLKK